MGRVTKLLILMLFVNIGVGVVVFSNKPEPPSVGYETIIENIEVSSEDDIKEKPPIEDKKLVGL